ncbi:MAG: OadG family protein [bacterium]
MLQIGLWLTLMGMSAVAFSLSLLIFSVKILKLLFPARREKAGKPEKKKQKRTGEILVSSAPDEILAVTAVEHHRRQLALGRRLGEYGGQKRK